MHGTEGAFTLIHNFLITGVCVIIVGLLVIVWSVKHLHTKYGASVFLALLLLLTLVGGGIGHIILFIPTWAFATRINKPLLWWKRILPDRLREILSPFWIYSLIATLVSWLVVMQLGIFGYFPGEENPDNILNIVFIFLFATVLLATFTFICAIAGDSKKAKEQIVG